MTTEPFLPYARQSIQVDDIAQVAQTLQSNLISRGPKVQAFEHAVAEYCSARYSVAFNSGSSAMTAACHVAGIGPSDRVFTTPNTFVATVIGAMHCGANPIFIDIDPNTGNLDLEQLKVNLNYPSTRGRDVIIPVHFAGIPVDMKQLDAMINHPNTIVIEDAAHALGSSYADGQKVGSCAWSKMTVFSFHPHKNITTGEGGMVTTNDEDLYRALCRFRNNGIERDPHYLSEELTPWFYEVQEVTGNYNFTDFQAALGLSQLQKLETFIAKRRKFMSLYREQMKDMPHVTLFDSKYDQRTAYHLFIVQIDFSAYKTTRKEVVQKLLDAGIGTQVHYIPLYRHPFFVKKYGEIHEYFPQMESYYSKALTLPLHCEMTEKDVHRVFEALRTLISGK